MDDRSPTRSDARLGLARAFYEEGMYTHAPGALEALVLYERPLEDREGAAKAGPLAPPRPGLCSRTPRLCRVAVAVALLASEQAANVLAAPIVLVGIASLWIVRFG